MSLRCQRQNGRRHPMVRQKKSANRLCASVLTSLTTSRYDAPLLLQAHGKPGGWVFGNGAFPAFPQAQGITIPTKPWTVGLKYGSGKPEISETASSTSPSLKQDWSMNCQFIRLWMGWRIDRADPSARMITTNDGQKDRRSNCSRSIRYRMAQSGQATNFIISLTTPSKVNVIYMNYFLNNWF